MTKTTNDYVAIYKSQLEKGDIQVAYKRLFDFMGALKAYFNRETEGKFTYGNIMPGYMDYTYIYFHNDYLRSKKLRFGLVLNHQKMCFELWLLGQNAEIQNNYWSLLRESKWNKGRTEMPEYSVLEVVLEETPDFNDPDHLSSQVFRSAVSEIGEIIDYLIGYCD